MNAFPHSRRPLTVLALVLLPVLAPALGGCGSGSAGSVVSGTVKLGGAPLSGGEVDFVADDGKGRATALIDAEGHYRAAGVPVGPAKIAVQPPGPSSDPKAPRQAGPAMPAHYRDPNKSGLTYSVKSGDQTHDIDLTP